MGKNDDIKEKAASVGCLGVLVIAVALLIGCVAVGMLLGAAYGTASAALVVLAIGSFLVWSAQKVSRKADEKETSDER